MLDPIQRTHRFLELDALRGIAAFAVVLSHFRASQGAASPLPVVIFSHLLGSGTAAVMLFFLLSGFVLTGPYLGARAPGYGLFLIKRICRIYLPYAAAILIAAALAARLFSTIPTGNHWIDQTWSRPFSVPLLAQHLLMVGHYDNTQLNTAIWSLVIEMRISILFPLIPWLSRRIPPAVLIGLMMPSTILLALLSVRTGHALVIDTLFYGQIFLLGSILRTHLDRILQLLHLLSRAQTLALLGLGCLCYQLGDVLPLSRLPLPGPLPVYLEDWCFCLGAVVFLLLAISSRALRHVLHGGLFLWAGARSYSIYLLHATVLFTMIRLHPAGPPPLFLFPVYLAITLTVAEGFHRWIELPTTPGGVIGRAVTRAWVARTGGAGA